MPSVNLNSHSIQAGVSLKRENLEESSLMRRIKEVVFKVFVNFWRSLGSYFGKVSIDIEVKNTENDPYREGVYKSLKQKRTLGQASVQAFCAHLDGVLHTGTQYNYLGFGGSLKPKGELGVENLLLFPVLLKGGLRSHIVAVVFDRLANRVELYDPKGLVARDRSAKVIKTNKTLSDVMLEVHKQYADPVRPSSSWENTAKHQKDSHNCGVYVLDYFQRRAGRDSPEKIAQEGRSFIEANNSVRQQMIKTLFFES